MDTRGNQDDGASVVQKRQRLLYREKHPARVDIECLIEMVRRRGCEKPKLDESRAGHNDVQPLLFSSDGLVKRVQIFKLRHIASDGRNISSNFHSALVH